MSAALTVCMLARTMTRQQPCIHAACKFRNECQQASFMCRASDWSLQLRARGDADEHVSSRCLAGRNSHGQRSGYASLTTPDKARPLGFALLCRQTMAADPAASGLPEEGSTQELAQLQPRLVTTEQ